MVPCPSKHRPSLFILLCLLVTPNMDRMEWNQLGIISDHDNGYHDNQEGGRCTLCTQSGSYSIVSAQPGPNGDVAQIKY